MNEKNKLFEESIILIGPSGAGKSEVAEILRKITGMPRICLDRIANDERKSGYIQKFDCVEEYNHDMLKRMLELAKKNGEPGIVDFGAGHSVYDDLIIFNDIKLMLKSFKNIVLLLPSVDIEKSLAIMSKRSTGDFSVNRKFLTSPCNRDLATLVEYENGRTPQEIAESIINRIKSRSNREEITRN